MNNISDMFNAIVSQFSRQGVVFQLIFLAWPRLPRPSTETSRVIEILFWNVFSLVRELCLTQATMTRLGVKLTISNHSQFQSPSSRFTSLRHQARLNKIVSIFNYWIFLKDHFKVLVFNLFIVCRISQLNLFYINPQFINITYATIYISIQFIVKIAMAYDKINSVIQYCYSS